MTLMLGIGANVVVFGVLNAVLLHPLDVREPQDLYQLRHKQWVSGRLLTTSYPAFEDLRRRNTSFSDMAGHECIFACGAARPRQLAHGGRRGRGERNYFDLLGVQPAVGQFFHAADEHGPGSAPYVVLSNDLWRNAFHGDHGIVGTTVEIEQASVYRGGRGAGAVPRHRAVSLAGLLDTHGERSAIERETITWRTGPPSAHGDRPVKPGVTAQQATENLNAIVAELAKEYPATDEGLAVRLIHPGLFGDDGEVIGGVSLERDRAGFAGAGGGLREPGNAVCGARGRSQPGIGASRGPGIEPAAPGAAIADRSDGGFAGGRSRRTGGRVPAAGRVEPLASLLGGHLAISVDARVYLAGLGIDSGKRAAFRHGSGAAGMAKRSFAEHEERAGGCTCPPAPVCLARLSCWGRRSRSARCWLFLRWWRCAAWWARWMARWESSRRARCWPRWT